MSKPPSVTSVGGTTKLRPAVDDGPKYVCMSCHEIVHTDQSDSTEAKPITVIVGKGDSATTFYVHEDVAKAHSDFFAAALRNGWKESEERVVRLPEETAERFRVFAKFLYTGKIFSRKEGDKPSAKEDWEWDRLSGCWRLGDKLGSTSFQDAIVDAINHKIESTKSCPTQLHQGAYRDTATSNSLRRLAVDIAVWNWEAMIAEAKQGPWDTFFLDLAVRLHGLDDSERNATAPFLGDTCKYHEHVAAKKPCYKTMFS